LCTERPSMNFRSAAANPRRRRDERSEIIVLFVELYQIMNFLTSAVWIFLSSHILRQPCLFAQPATTPLLTRRSARLETITNHVQNYQSWLTSQISSCVFTFADYVQIFHTKKVAYKAHSCYWSIVFL
jgi:hypothetical protein